MLCLNLVNQADPPGAALGLLFATASAPELRTCSTTVLNELQSGH